MIIIKPANDKGYFWQWDTGQYLRVDGAPEVHFGRPGEESTIDVAVVDGLAKVPDERLTVRGTLQVYAYDTNHTLSRSSVSVLGRQKPAGYIATPAESKTWGELDKRIEALEAGGSVAGVASVNGATGNVTITAKILGALTPDDLQDATDAALAQAKASGAFDGSPGPQGPQGDPGPKGDTGAGMDITGATVGQIAKITAVDADGKPTAWEPVDMPGEKEWVKVVDLDFTEENSLGQVFSTLENASDIYILGSSLGNSATTDSGFSLFINSKLIVESMQAIRIGKTGSLISQRAYAHYNGLFWDVMASATARNNNGLKTTGGRVRSTLRCA